MEQMKWTENVILVDADYVDVVTSRLRIYFEEMLGRHIPKADMAQWLVCVALDGGIHPGRNEVQVVLVHGRDKKEMENFVPSVFSAELDGKAFTDENLGEFRLSSVCMENIVSKEDFFMQSIEVLAKAMEIKNLIVVPDMDKIGARVRPALEQMEGKNVTLLAMEPQDGQGARQELLGYSLMNALGIRSEELS